MSRGVAVIGPNRLPAAEARRLHDTMVAAWTFPQVKKAHVRVREGKFAEALDCCMEN